MSPARPRKLAAGAAVAAIVGFVTTVTSLSPSTAQSGPWIGERLDLGRPVAVIRQIDTDVYVEAGRWYRAVACAETVCFEPGRPPGRGTARGGIPSGTIATATGPGIVEAWYSDPTDRYDHGILGDRIEGGSLTVIDDAGLRYTLTLDVDHVFEDLTPRIADIDGDGANDVVAIRSGINDGAGIAVYGLSTGGLAEIANIPPIGRTHRWLNLAGIADFNGDGLLDIAIVKTPHIGGRLEIWTMRGQLGLIAAADGFSNHAIGSTELGLSAIADVNGDGVADLALPNDGSATLRIVSLRGGAIIELAAIALAAPIATAIGSVHFAGGSAFLAGLENGSLVLVHADP